MNIWIFLKMEHGREYLQRSQEAFTKEEKRVWLDGNTNVALGSDAFFPFGDNIERAYKGVKYIAQPGGSIRDDNIIGNLQQESITMCFTGMNYSTTN